MKKYLIFSLLSLIFTFSVFAEKTNDVHPTKRIEANPINIAIMLMQEKDTASMASTRKLLRLREEIRVGWINFVAIF